MSREKAWCIATVANMLLADGVRRPHDGRPHNHFSAATHVGCRSTPQS